MNKHFIATVLFTAGFIVQAQAATWYVATDGNDGSSCSSSSTPCASINGAYQKAVGGDIIQLAAGTYGCQTLNAKSPTSNIIVKPASGASVTLGSLTLNGATRLEINDLTTQEFKVNLNTNYVTLRNVDVNGGLFYLGGSNVSMIGGSVGPGVDYHPQIAPNNGWQGQGMNFVLMVFGFMIGPEAATAVHTECLQVAGTTNMVIRNSKFTNCAVFDLSFTSYNNAGRVTNLLMENNFFDTAVSGGYFSVHFSAMENGL